MGNNASGETPSSSAAQRLMDDGVFTGSVQTKIRLMGALSHDCRWRAEERSHLRERLEELKAERRRISVDLRWEGSANDDGTRPRIGSFARHKLTRDSDKPAWAAYESDRVCAQCGKEAPRDKNYPCRVCTRIFHPECLRQCGDCTPADIKLATDRALSNEGWSCYRCNDLSRFLTESDFEFLIQAFDEFDRDNDNLVTWQEFQQARRRSDTPWGRSYGSRGSLADVENTVSRLEFLMADQDGDQCLNWWEFLNLAAQHLLGKRDEEELVKLLSEKEVVRAKAMFRELDKDGDGVVTGLEARRAIRTWCSQLSTGLHPDQVAQLSTTIDSHVEVRARMLVDGDDEEKDMITWPDFLAQQALYILCSRPNMADNVLDNLNVSDSKKTPDHLGRPASLTRNSRTSSFSSHTTEGSTSPPVSNNVDSNGNYHRPRVGSNTSEERKGHKGVVSSADQHDVTQQHSTSHIAGRKPDVVDHHSQHATRKHHDVTNHHSQRTTKKHHDVTEDHHQRTTRNGHDVTQNRSPPTWRKHHDVTQHHSPRAARRAGTTGDVTEHQKNSRVIGK